MKVALKDLPAHRVVPITDVFVAELIAGLPMRSALGEDGPAGEGQLAIDLHADSDDGEACVFGRGTLTAKVFLACSRCLERATIAVADALHVTFLPSESMNADSRQTDPDATECEDATEEEDTYPYEGKEIDLSLVVREKILLTLPYAPLCSEDCAGLCSQCGVNLNQSECQCGEKGVDPRLAALRNIKV